MELAERVRLGVEALRGGRPSDAAALLAPVAEDAELAATDDLEDVRARVLSLYAQALLESGRPELADKPARDALKIADATADEAGRHEIRALRRRVMAALAERQQRLVEEREKDRVARTPLPTLLDRITDPVARAAVLTRKANAEADAGRLDVAAELASTALTEAAGASVREEVFARLTLARARPDTAEAELLAAWRVAAEANEFNLVGAVAKAATHQGIVLPTEVAGGRAR